MVTTVSVATVLFVPDPLVFGSGMAKVVRSVLTAKRGVFSLAAAMMVTVLVV